MKKDVNYVKWATLYKGLANVNRLKILALLHEHDELSVTALSKHLKISLKNTSWNLKTLLDLELVEYQGKKDHVFYKLNPEFPEEVKKTLNISIF